MRKKLAGKTVTSMPGGVRSGSPRHSQFQRCSGLWGTDHMKGSTLLNLYGIGDVVRIITEGCVCVACLRALDSRILWLWTGLR